MEIIPKEENGVEFYTVELTGQSGMSQSGLAILAGVSQQAISNLEKTLTSRSPSESLEPFVGEALTLTIPDPTIDGRPVGNLTVYKASYCAAVLKHYATRDPNPVPAAIFSLVKFAEIGINAWIQEITGWRQRVESIRPYTDVYIQRIEHMRDHQIADEHWMIFREASELLLLLEKDWCVPINDYDILDGSIGRKWSDYRNERDHSWLQSPRTYTHAYRDQRGNRECAAYYFDELPHFKRWLRESYIPIHLPKYLINKYGKQSVLQIYTETGLLNDYILQLTETKRLTPQEIEKHRSFLLARQRLLEGFSFNELNDI